MKPLSPLLLLLLLSGCLEDFDPPHLIKEPRILAITAEPPEVAFGEDVLFEALIVDGDGTDLSASSDVERRFMVCVSLAEILRAIGFGASGLDDDCDEGGDDLVRLETGGDLPPGVARLPGAALLRLVDDLMGMGGAPVGGAGIDPEVARTLAFVIAEVGVPLRMRLEVWRGGELILVGSKRFAITQREMATTNPPPPRFAVGDVWLSARDSDEPHRCTPEDGQAPVVEAGAEILLRPDENEEAWIEEYPAIDLEAEVVINEESAYYSWFSTGGVLSDNITQRPLRDVTWTAPEEPGTYPLWLVVRDGHLGQSYCRADITVVP